MEPKNYSTIRSILKWEQDEKITYEIYQQLYANSNRSINTAYQEDISGQSQELNSKKQESPETSEESRKKRKVSEE